MKLCDMCGKTLKSGTSLGGAIVCRLCVVDLGDEMERLHEAGKSVHGLKIARKIFRETFSNGNLLIKDIPNDLLARVMNRAHEEGDSVRDFIVKSIYDIFQEHGESGKPGDGKRE